MRQIRQCRILAWGFIWIAISQVSALEISGRTGLMLFDSGIQDFPDNIRESGAEYNFIGNLSVKQEYSDLFSLDISMDYDPILLNRVITRVGIHTRFFSIQGGPCLGLFNTQVILNPGISLIATGNIASFIFGSFQFDTTLNNGSNQPGDYTQNLIQCRISFDIPMHLAAVLGMNARTHTRKQENGAGITNEWTRYYFSAEHKEKLWLFSRISGTLGYQELGWAGSLVAWNMEYKHRSIYAGIDLGFQISPSMSLFFATEMPIYSWVTQNIQGNSPQGMMLYEFTLGATWSVDPVTDK